MPNREEVRVETNGEDITLGLDAGSVSASISSNGDLTLGIGIAEVEINLKDPNDATLSFGFGLYTIDGERQGCTVILRYYIAGQLAMTETRVIPECDEPEPTPEPTPEPDPDPNPNPNDDFPLPPSPKVPNPYQRYTVLIHQKKFEYSDAIVYGDTSSAQIVNPQVIQEGVSYTYSVRSKGSAWYYSLNGRIVYGEKHSFSQSSPFWEVDDARVFWPTSWIKTFPSFYKSIGIVGVHGLGLDINNLCDTVFASYVKKTVNRWWVHNYLSGYYDAETERWIVTGPFRSGAQEWGVFQKSFSIEIIKESSYPPILKHPPPYKEEEKMDDNCCEMIEEIYEALSVKELLNEGFIIPNRMIVPNGKGTTKLENYLSILEHQMRQTDHLGVHPFVATIKDSNEAQAGDQSLSIQFPNATAAIKYIAELTMENKGDAATRLSLLVRLSYATAQIITILVQTGRGIKALSSFFGMPIIERVESVKIPFDILLGLNRKEKGFGKESKISGEQIKAELLKKIDQNSEDATEDMLPDFMKVADLEVKTQDFRPSTEFDFWAALKRTLKID